MFFDPLYFLILAPGLALAAWAQWITMRAYRRTVEIPVGCGMSGAEVAAEILDSNGLAGVSIEEVDGELSDHYDPTAKALRLSPDIFHGRSIASVAIAAHEAGHALQDGRGYLLLVMRNYLVPAAALGTNVAGSLIVLGLSIKFAGLIWLGILAFSLVVLFQLVNLPVEFDASRRAKRILFEKGIIGEEERGAVRSMLTAAAMTYVAATTVAALTLVYYLVRAGVLGEKRSNS